MDRYSSDMLLERAKELSCLYAVDEILQNKTLTLPGVIRELAFTIPMGFTSPEACRVKVTVNSETFMLPDFVKAEEMHRCSILSDGEESIGEISVGYIPSILVVDCPLLEEEVKLLNSISRRISIWVTSAERELSLMLDVLQRIDPDMLLYIRDRLTLHLKNIIGLASEAIFDKLDIATYGEINSPLARQTVLDPISFSKKLISGAVRFLSPTMVFDLVNGWIQEQRILTLVKMVDNKDSSVSSILDAIRRYVDVVGSSKQNNTTTETWLLAELAGRFLSNNEQAVDLVLNNLTISDFISILEKIICSESSKGNIGSKGAGLFIAGKILEHEKENDLLVSDILTPKTWYIAADQIVDFLHYNDMEDMNSYKYNSIAYIRITYDNVVLRMKNAKLPPRTVQMLRLVLDDLGDLPIIVRSSSLLEDRKGGIFSGKYKSLFLANIGTREERLSALVDAVLEVYSSMYNPDAMQYRRERELLNSVEEMGILIQEVVGTKIGHYYMPHFAGVAFSENLLCWSPRITKEGGLTRMVMGLGTGAVDRVNNDYPVLFSPANPDLLINITPDDIRYYSPKFVDLINLDNCSFETVDINTFFKEAGKDFPELYRYVSVYTNEMIERKNAFSLDIRNDEMLVTFDSILNSSDIPKKLKRILDLLSEKLGCPVDTEFAYDGKNIYLLQCRPQSDGISGVAAPIPQNLNSKDILFTANRFITNGQLKDISHIVYVDSEGYSNLATREELLAVGTVVSLLNDILPRKKFILMGPGRWGSRGDIKLGVHVTYSDISSTAALIEIAKQKYSYVPELSFGTHFFQDLVESKIIYLPLYPDQPDVKFQENLFRHSPNILGEILPNYEWLSDVVRVIDLKEVFLGRTLSINMNSDLNQAIAFLEESNQSSLLHHEVLRDNQYLDKSNIEREYWQWRHYMALQIAESLDMELYGVKAIYLFGSTDNGNPGMGSDIDLLLHVDGNEEQTKQLEKLLEGWSRALARINFLQTGYDTDKLLDIHFVTDKSISEGESFSSKINSTVEPATLLRRRL